MQAPVDWPGSLKYLLLRLNPFLDQAWATHRASGLKFRVHPRDVVGRTILRRKSYEPGLTGWLLAELERGASGIFLDIGANIGWYSLQAARSGLVQRVVAIEPDAANHRLLQTNITRNALDDRIDAVACAVGAEPGMARLHRYKASNLGRHSLLADHGLGGSWVPVQTLDRLLDQLDLGDAPIAAAKIDVEGYEPFVVAGAAQALRRTRILLVELSPALTGTAGPGVNGMLDAIAAAGFAPRIWDGGGAVPGFSGLRDHPEQVTVGFRRSASPGALA